MIKTLLATSLLIAATNANAALTLTCHPTVGSAAESLWVNKIVAVDDRAATVNFQAATITPADAMWVEDGFQYHLYRYSSNIAFYKVPTPEAPSVTVIYYGNCS